MPRSFLARRLAAGGELGHRAERRGLGHLAAGVRVHLGVEHQHVDVAAGGQDVVQAAVADVVGPAVAADDPDALLHQGVGQAEQVAASRVVLSAPASLPCSVGHPLALGGDAGFVGLVGVQEAVDQFGADHVAPAGSPVRGRTRPACRSPGACPGRTRRCPRTASWTRPGRGRRLLTSRAWWAGCRRRSTSSRWRWRPSCGRRRAG